MMSLSTFLIFTFLSSVCVSGEREDLHNYLPGELEYESASFGTPVESMRTCELIQRYGYPCESHEVKTVDGYILLMHRIPHGLKEGANTTSNSARRVVFLQHGLTDSSATWVMNDPDKSLAYLLADRGYDVWMGNNRGNTYSDRHVFLKTYEEKFWDFSWDEMALYDLPAAVDFVLKKTDRKKLFYIGHSQGTTQAFAAFSHVPKLGEKIEMYIALAPVTHCGHIKGLLRSLSSVDPLVKLAVKMLGTKDFFPNSIMMKYIAQTLCKSTWKPICMHYLFSIVGYDTSNINMTMMPFFMSHCPAGTSVKSMIHFSQMIKSGMYRRYDYGWNGNMQRYKRPTPPEYYVGEMRVPTAIFTGSYDWLSTYADVATHLLHQLPNLIYAQNDYEWNHMDFVWAHNAKSVVYDSVIVLLGGGIPDNPHSIRLH